MKTNNVEKFTSSYGTSRDIQCKSCAHWSPAHATVCAAYPQGIPAVILFGEADHKKPLPNDHGIQWTAKQ
ncbi:hypothetical protein [Rhodoferax sp.]|uniref:hypothetical protein n=1 Tax=Rhodoferax sp. TaxID=50421 RepID=UPI00283DB974|nr:hypothetical protein [Rhodoferax sp.]MDR3368097.1 hypothetical protein [Rhodoferax sp.]